MSTMPWRAVELPIPGGSIAVDVTGSGRLARQTVWVSHEGTTRIISSLPELRGALGHSPSAAEQLANTDPVSFAYLLCVLSGRAHHVFPRDAMWPELEEHFGLSRSANRARVEQGKFVFVAYSHYLPALRVSRITVDLATLELQEDVLVNSPWPPLPAGSQQAGD